jgi:ABC-type sugar transport system permease subunit
MSRKPVSPPLRRRKRADVVPYLFVAPAVIILATFLILPILMSFRYSLTNFSLLRPKAVAFVGLQNYAELVADAVFFRALRNTVYYTVVIVPIQCALALCLALLVKRPLPGISAFRIAYFSPLLLSMTVVSILWTFIYNPTPGQGLINSYLVKLGLPPNPFLYSEKTAMNSIVAMSVWQATGYQMMIFLAGLQGIPSELYEAASIDGAGRFRQFLSVTIPGLHNVTVYVLLLTTISAMKMFVQAFVMTQGGPNNSTRSLVYYIYEQGIQYRNVGYSCSVTVFYFCIVVSVSFALKRVMDKGREGTP